MPTTEFEKRLTALEAEVANLKFTSASKNRWWDKIAGAFAGNPRFETAMRNARNWQEPKHTKARRPTP